MRKLPRYQLRSKPINVCDDDCRETFGLDVWNNKPFTHIENDYKDNGDGTVTDNATGLTWQQSGSDEMIQYNKALSYTEELNQKRFGGYSDWRLPTVEELISLLEKYGQPNNLFIDTIFDKKQLWCWSTDKRSSGSGWGIIFNSGSVACFNLRGYLYVRAVRS